MHIYRRALFYAFFLAVSRAFIAPLPTRVSLIHSCHESRGSSRLRAVSSVSDNKELLPGILAIQESNRELLQHLDSIRQKPYFRFYSVDILASCEYMPQELHECDDACEIYPVDEEEVRACARWVQEGVRKGIRSDVSVSPWLSLSSNSLGTGGHSTNRHGRTRF